MPENKPRVERNRQAVLNTARAIIARRGIEGLSMRILAEKADYSPSTLYRYFKNKEEILDELAQQALAHSLKQTENWAQPDSDPVETVLRSGMNLYYFAREHPTQYTLMTSPTPSAPKNLEEFMENPNFKSLTQLLEQGAASSQLNIPEGFNPELLAVLLWFAIHGASTLRVGMMRDYGVECDALMDELFQALKSMLKSSCDERLE